MEEGVGAAAKFSPFSVVMVAGAGGGGGVVCMCSSDISRTSSFSELAGVTSVDTPLRFMDVRNYVHYQATYAKNSSPVS